MARSSTDADKWFSPAERRNWGYWDGKAARERGRYPEWAECFHPRKKHPFDKQYGDGFWAGWYGEPHPNTGVA